MKISVVIPALLIACPMVACSQQSDEINAIENVNVTRPAAVDREKSRARIGGSDCASIDRWAKMVAARDDGTAGLFYTWANLGEDDGEISLNANVYHYCADGIKDCSGVGMLEHLGGMITGATHYTPMSRLAADIIECSDSDIIRLPAQHDSQNPSRHVRGEIRTADYSLTVVWDVMNCDGSISDPKDHHTIDMFHECLNLRVSAPDIQSSE